jgi:hypothetical protein
MLVITVANDELHDRQLRERMAGSIAWDSLQTKAHGYGVPLDAEARTRSHITSSAWGGA